MQSHSKCVAFAAWCRDKTVIIETDCGSGGKVWKHASQPSWIHDWDYRVADNQSKRYTFEYLVGSSVKAYNGGASHLVICAKDAEQLITIGGIDKAIKLTYEEFAKTYG